VAAVVSIAFGFGMKMSAIKKSLEAYKPHSKRMEIVKMTSGVVVINDCYNANPESFEAAMQTLKNIPAKGKKYVVAGDMFELGDRSKAEHTALGKVMAEYNFNGYYFSGEAMKSAFKKLKSTKPKARAIHLESKTDIALILSAVLQKGDVILLKGSRGMKMEQLLDLL
jgi:UDP-N-acetylmuramoyl-tripeptide--D-alanyl-D-alanine ligase